MNHRIRSLGLAFVTMVILLGPGCAKQSVTVPTGAPSIAGTISSVGVTGDHAGSILVEASPVVVDGIDKASVRILEETALTGADGRPIEFNELEVGRRVRVWFKGPVRESYPVQADAQTVVLDGPGAMP